MGKIIDRVRRREQRMIVRACVIDDIEQRKRAAAMDERARRQAYGMFNDAYARQWSSLGVQSTMGPAYIAIPADDFYSRPWWKFWG